MPSPKPRVKKPSKPATLTKEAALESVRRILRSSGFDEESQEGDRISFASREGGDMEEDRADPELVRFARTKAKEIEAAVPGSKVRVEPVDEWVSIAVTLPGSSASAPPKKPPPAPVPAAPVLSPPPWAKGPQRSLKPGDEIEYMHLTYGNPVQRKAIVGWDHGKRVEAHEPGSRTGFTLERGQDGKLYRHGF